MISRVAMALGGAALVFGFAYAVRRSRDSRHTFARRRHVRRLRRWSARSGLRLGDPPEEGGEQLPLDVMEHAQAAAERGRASRTRRREHGIDEEIRSQSEWLHDPGEPYARVTPGEAAWIEARHWLPQEPQALFAAGYEAGASARGERIVPERVAEWIATKSKLEEEQPIYDALIEKGLVDDSRMTVDRVIRWIGNDTNAAQDRELRRRLDRETSLLDNIHENCVSADNACEGCCDEGYLYVGSGREVATELARAVSQDLSSNRIAEFAAALNLSSSEWEVFVSDGDVAASLREALGVDGSAVDEAVLFEAEAQGVAIGRNPKWYRRWLKENRDKITERRARLREEDAAAAARARKDRQERRDAKRRARGAVVAPDRPLFGARRSLARAGVPWHA